MARMVEGPARASPGKKTSQAVHRRGGRLIFNAVWPQNRTAIIFGASVQEMAGQEADVKYTNVRYAIYIRGLTQHQFAPLVEMSESRLSRCGRGVLRFTPEERRRIAESLGYEE